MKLRTFFVLLTFMLMVTLYAGTVLADSTLSCKGVLFTGGERIGGTKEEVFNACGKPANETYLHWAYYRNGQTYILRFTPSGQVADIHSRKTIGDLND